MGGLLGRLMSPKIYRLRGQSRIVGADGSVLAELAEEEGVAVADVVMDASRKHYHRQASFGGWLQPGPALARKVIIPLDTAGATVAYSLSHDRRRKARACLTGQG